MEKMITWFSRVVGWHVLGKIRVALVSSDASLWRSHATTH